MGFLALVALVTATCCLARRRRRYSEPPSPVFISHSETVRNPALRYLGKVSSNSTSLDTSIDLLGAVGTAADIPC